MHLSSSYAKILGETNFRTREIPRNGPKAKDGKEEEKKKDRKLVITMAKLRMAIVALISVNHHHLQFGFGLPTIKNGKRASRDVRKQRAQPLLNKVHDSGSNIDLLKYSWIYTYRFFIQRTSGIKFIHIWHKLKLTEPPFCKAWHWHKHKTQFQRRSLGPKRCTKLGLSPMLCCWSVFTEGNYTMFVYLLVTLICLWYICCLSGFLEFF